MSRVDEIKSYISKVVDDDYQKRNFLNALEQVEVCRTGVQNSSCSSLIDRVQVVSTVKKSIGTEPAKVVAEIQRDVHKWLNVENIYEGFLVQIRNDLIESILNSNEYLRYQLDWAAYFCDILRTLQNLSISNPLEHIANLALAKEMFDLGELMSILEYGPCLEGPDSIQSEPFRIFNEVRDLAISKEDAIRRMTDGTVMRVLDDLKHAHNSTVGKINEALEDRSLVLSQQREIPLSIVYLGSKF